MSQYNFDKTCWSDESSLIAHAVGMSPVINSAGYSVINSVTYTGSVFIFSGNFFPLPSGSFVPFSYSLTLQSCIYTGHDASDSGMSISDAVTVSWSVVLCFAIAYSIKIIRNTL